MMQDLVPGPPQLGDRFVMVGGDGDQSFLGQPKRLRLVEASWFPGQNKFGRALLCIVEDGGFAGRYVALTARHVAGIEKELIMSGCAGVILHLISDATASFPDGPTDSIAVGIALIERRRETTARMPD